MNILITGGVGFIGTNAAINFLKKNHDVTIVDNFSRHGVNTNAEYLKKEFPQLKIIQSNIIEVENYLEELKKANVILHLAGQTAVTTSIKNPQLDFESNLKGSFTLLEAVREHNPNAIVLYSSTNKVYGDLSHHNVIISKEKTRYENMTVPLGAAENERIDLISPYGCSKGGADLYMLDYARIFGLNTVVFRQSCIYGPFQMGVEDQGWVAHFSKQILMKKPLTIYGDGLQVRDLLHVADLIKVYELTIENIEKVRGQAFNIGGGITNAYSLVEVIKMIEEYVGNKIDVSYSEERLGDQKWFVSANEKALKTLNWKPEIDLKNGIKDMIDWQKDFYK